MKPLGYLLLVFAVSSCWGQANSQAVQKSSSYDVTKEITIRGVIVQSLTSAPSMAGFTVLVQSGTQTFAVHLGQFRPAKDQFLPGQIVEVMGAMTHIRGTEVLLARLVKIDSESITVRNARGIAVPGGVARRSRTSR